MLRRDPLDHARSSSRLALVLSLAACSGAPGPRDLAPPPPPVIRVLGAERLSGASYLVVGVAPHDGRPMAGLLDLDRAIPFREVALPSAVGSSLGDLAGVPGGGGFLACATGGTGGDAGWIAHLRLDERALALHLVARHPLPAAKEPFEAIACAAGAAAAPGGDPSQPCLVFVATAGRGPEPARLRVADWRVGEPMRWRDGPPGSDVRAPPAADAARATDCEALYGAADGTIWALGTWGAGDSTGAAAGAVVYRLGAVDAALRFELAAAPKAHWTGLGVVLEALAGHPSGRGALAFGAEPSRGPAPGPVRR